MTRIAVLADIHGNVAAMEAVVADIGAAGVDEVLVGGDLVGRGPEGSAVVERIAELGWPSVRGNHEEYLIEFRAERVPAGWLTADNWSAARWLAAELSEQSVETIGAFPFSLVSTLEPELRLVHGSPRSPNEGIGPWCSDEEVEGQLDRVEEPVLVCAHTHRPLVRRFPTGLVVNVGSVGLPFNRDPRAHYAIFEHRDAAWSVELRQVEYDRGAVHEAYERSGFRRAGGVTARLLELELDQAAPFLVPFLKWTAAREIEPDEEALARFLADYEPDLLLPELGARLGGPTP